MTRRWEPEDDKIYRGLREKNISEGLISELMGFSRPTLRRKAEAMGLPYRKRGARLGERFASSVERAREIRAERAKGTPIKTIAADMGLTMSRIHQILKEPKEDEIG